MRNMTSLTSLVVEILMPVEHRAFQVISFPLLWPGWKALGSSLRSLDSRVPLDGMARCPLPILGETLVNLETLSMHICPADYTTSDGHTLLNSVLSFLVSQKYGLRSLTLDMGQQVSVRAYSAWSTSLAWLVFISSKSSPGMAI